MKDFRRHGSAILTCAGLFCWMSAQAAPSPSPTPKSEAKPAPSSPLKPTGPLKPLPKPSPTASEKPVDSAPPKTKSPAPASSSSPKPSSTRSTSTLKPDAELDVVADEFIRGYLAARPLHATELGFHEYDGRIFEYTRLAIDAELARLRRFDDRVKKFEPDKLSPRGAIDQRLLQAAIRKELFLMQDMGTYEHNPMSYARAIDVSVYVKRKYAPIEDRVRSIIVVENQAPNIIIAAKTNLADVF